MYENRNFLILSSEEVDKIDFNEVCETSAETLRYSVDGSKTFVKWDGTSYDPTPIKMIDPETNEITSVIPDPPENDLTPSFVQDLTTAEGPYSYEEILEILKGPEWCKPFDDQGE